LNAITMALPGTDWMMSNDERKLTLETIRHDKKATKMPMLMVRKLLDQNIPRTQEGRTIRDGKILFLARDEATAQKSEMNSMRLYDLCDMTWMRMDKMNQAQRTIFSRNMITEKRRGHTGSTENLPLHQSGANGSIKRWTT
jgi:hypothetical protein